MENMVVGLRPLLEAFCGLSIFFYRMHENTKKDHRPRRRVAKREIHTRRETLRKKDGKERVWGEKGNGGEGRRKGMGCRGIRANRRQRVACQIMPRCSNSSTLLFLSFSLSLCLCLLTDTNPETVSICGGCPELSVSLFPPPPSPSRSLNIAASSNPKKHPPYGLLFPVRPALRTGVG
ncbi:hypothetical protein GQ53DRAFT_73725 [Thozetella sp. PMI_491]|nr:hypothetical protein GQ53DRAFT_73725 [Thozetella sp. PMI_491]